jgi:hypothetical protein
MTHYKPAYITPDGYDGVVDDTAGWEGSGWEKSRKAQMTINNLGRFRTKAEETTKDTK